jgi:hypothetical protein
MKYFIELVDNLSKGKKRGGKSWWRVKGGNGQVLLTSETYLRWRTRDRVATNFAKATGLKIRRGIPTKPEKI